MSTDVEGTFAFVRRAGSLAVVERGGGEVVKHVGDAVLLRFAEPADAVVALWAVLRQEGDLLPQAGAHHGRAVAVDGDYYGAAVNLASRVAGQARAGQLLVTGKVALAARSVGAVVTHAGTPRLRNMSDPIDLWEVAEPAMSSGGEVGRTWHGDHQPRCR